MFNKKLGVFVKNTRFPNAPDMSQLSPFYFRIIDSKKILKNTMDLLESNIVDEDLGGFRRFRKFEICEDWHWYTGGSGSWVALTAWASRFYKALGRKEKAEKYRSWITEVASHSGGLLPEHIARKEEYEDWKNHEIEFNSRILNETSKAEKSMKFFRGKEVVYWATPLGWSHAEYILLENSHTFKYS